MKMWKLNVNSVVLLYTFVLVLRIRLASDKSTEIKTLFLRLEPYNTDTTLLLLYTFYNQENLGKFWHSTQMRFVRGTV